MFGADNYIEHKETYTRCAFLANDGWSTCTSIKESIVEKIDKMVDEKTKGVMNPPLAMGVPRDAINPDHYQSEIQPIDFINANKLTFNEGNAVKYIARCKRK